MDKTKRHNKGLNCPKCINNFQVWTEMRGIRIPLYNKQHMFQCETKNFCTYIIKGDSELMDFQSTNPLNVWLNLLSGNLFPITENSSFPLFWKIHSAFVWLFELIFIAAFIPVYFLIPKKIRFSDGLIGSVIIDGGDVVLEYFRIFAQTTLVKQLIRKLNKALSIEDENMRHIVIMNLKPLEIPFKIYLVTGIFIAFSWHCMPFLLIFERSTFYYTDYKLPVVFSKEPFSVGIFLLGNVIILVNGVYIFLRKASVDVYTTHLISLVSAQYQYVALRLVLIFRSNKQQDNTCCQEDNSEIDSFVAKEIKKLCRQHIDVMNLTSMLKKLLSVNIFFTYVNNVFRFCFLGLMATKLISSSLLEGCMAMIYASGIITQFYVLCACFQKLSDASSEITNKAFHEDWNQFNLSIKRAFLLMITASNNIKLKLSLYDKFNLSLSSFMSVLNSAYSIALLILRMI